MELRTRTFNTYVLHTHRQRTFHYYFFRVACFGFVLYRLLQMSSFPNLGNPYDPRAVDVITDQAAQQRTTPAIEWTVNESCACMRYATTPALSAHYRQLRDGGASPDEVLNTLRRRSRETTLWNTVRVHSNSDASTIAINTSTVKTPIDSGIDVITVTVIYDNRVRGDEEASKRIKR